MSPKKQQSYRNHLLQALSDDDRRLLTRHLEPVELSERRELEKAGKAVTHIYFPESGIVSVVLRGPRQRPLEIGLIGREGVTGTVVLLGDGRPVHSAYVQVPGRAYRMATKWFRTAVDESPTCKGMFLRYTHSLMIQTAYTAISNAKGKLEERLARWLLMADDRIDGNELPLVHEFLAIMLGVRRAGVTVALHRLEGSGLIEVRRGRIVVLDRSGLEEAANGFYGKTEAEYERLMKRSIDEDAH